MFFLNYKNSIPSNLHKERILGNSKIITVTYLKSPILVSSSNILPFKSNASISNNIIDNSSL